MGKNNTKSLDNDQAAQILEEIMAELLTARSQIKKLASAQKEAKRELHALKKKLAKLPLCKCSKRKKSTSKKKTKAVSSQPQSASQPEVLTMVSSDATAGDGVDDLKLISGVGPKLEQTLNDLGVFRYEQIAGWGESELKRIDDYLNFSGRIQRENWIDQVKALAKGGRDEYVKVFGKESR